MMENTKTRTHGVCRKKSGCYSFTREEGSSEQKMRTTDTQKSLQRLKLDIYKHE
jgi:hypothetical protein